MCTQFFIEPEIEEIVEVLDEARSSRLNDRFIKAGSAVLNSGVIKPTNVVPVIASDKRGRRSVFPMKWGFKNTNRPLLVNARSETADEKPTFKDLWAQHRCIIPAAWYFEWKHFKDANGREKVGDKYMIQPRNSSVTWLAGLYRIERNLPVFVVLTREPSDDLRCIHDRMPLILPKNMIDGWIDPHSEPSELLQYALTEVFMEAVV